MSRKYIPLVDKNVSVSHNNIYNQVHAIIMNNII